MSASSRKQVEVSGKKDDNTQMLSDLLHIVNWSFIKSSANGIVLYPADCST